MGRARPTCSNPCTSWRRRDRLAPASNANCSAGACPHGRRQYLNLANSQAYQKHMRALQRYNRVLLQRNQVLRLVREGRQPMGALEPWTEQMLEWGALVLGQRVTMLGQLDERITTIFRD